jgi:hypothetical protein
LLPWRCTWGCWCNCHDDAAIAGPCVIPPLMCWLTRQVWPGGVFIHHKQEQPAPVPTNFSPLHC